MYRDDKRRKYGKGICYENIIHEKYLSYYQGYGMKNIKLLSRVREEKYLSCYQGYGKKNI